MVTGKALVELAKKHIGEKYVLGIVAPKDDPDYKGPFDCAELGSYCVYQLTDRLYGCANNNGNPHGADAYSGFWGRDAQLIGEKISINEANQTAGCFLIRIAGNGMIGHVAMTQGNGKTVEAYSTKRGVIENVVSGRRWDYAVKIPWIFYTITPIPNVDVVNKKPTVKIYRYANPLMHDAFIKKIQTVVGVKADGWFGLQTFNAVRSFQLKKGLVPDGEVGPKTLRALNLFS